MYKCENRRKGRRIVMKDAHKLKITHSSVLNKQGKPFVSVMIEREQDCAEGSVPECRITKSKGFDEEEIGELEEYLRNHGQEIIDEAKKITGFMKLFS